MKKFLLLILVVALGVTTNAQTSTKSAKTGQTYSEIKTDYTLTNAVESWFQFNFAQPQKATQDFRVKLDSLAGNHTNVAVAIYGRKFDSDSWTQIGSTVNWLGTTADTTIIISNTSANRFRQYKVGYTGTGTGTTTISNQEVKVWLE